MPILYKDKFINQRPFKQIWESTAIEGITMTLTYKKRDGTTFDRTVTTASDGSFSDSYKAR